MFSIMLLTISLAILFIVLIGLAEKTYRILGKREIILLMVFTIIVSLYLMDLMLCYHIDIPN